MWRYTEKKHSFNPNNHKEQEQNISSTHFLLLEEELTKYLHQPFTKWQSNSRITYCEQRLLFKSPTRTYLCLIAYVLHRNSYRLEPAIFLS